MEPHGANTDLNGNTGDDGSGNPSWNTQKQVFQYSSHDPACDQCRIKKIRCGREQPRCFNCQRSKATCDFSDRGKRPNQTKQLLSEFDRLELRLSRIEEAVGNCSASIEELALSPARSRSQSTCRCFSPERDDQEINSSKAFFNDDDKAIKSPRASHLVLNQSGDENYYGSCSMLALFSEAQKAMHKATLPYSSQPQGRRKRSSSATQDDFLAAAARATGAIFRSLTQEDSIDMSQDGQQLALPPKGLLDASVEPFFRQLNKIFPIFHEETFCREIDQLYSGSPSDTGCAWLVSFNNVILQVLSSKPKSFDIKTHGGFSAMDAELLKPFLMNSRRAFVKLDQLLKLRLASVQALLTLAFVAHEQWQLSLAELLLGQACEMAKRMGLHQQVGVTTDQTVPQAEERRKLFWTLFILDKNVSLLSGNSCCLPSYDCDVLLPECTDNPLEAHFLARIRLARIREHIYKYLYSVEASRRSETERERTIAQLNRELNDWKNMHQAILRQEDIDGTKLEELTSAELSYCLCNSRIMVHRMAPGSGRKEDVLNDARSSLAIIKKLSLARGTISGTYMLRRLFQSYPFAGFFEIFSSIFDYPQRSSAIADVILLRSVVSILGDTCTSAQHTTYCAKLHLATSACTDIAERYIAWVDESRGSSSKRSASCSDASSPEPLLSYYSYPLSSSGSSSATHSTVTSANSAIVSPRSSSSMSSSSQQMLLSPALSTPLMGSGAAPATPFVLGTNGARWLNADDSVHFLHGTEVSEYFSDWTNVVRPDCTTVDHVSEDVMNLGVNHGGVEGV